MLGLLSAVLSNLVSNVPAVLLFKPIIPAMPAPDQEIAWLALAMSSTLAGNLTILGSVANLIVVENARKEGVADLAQNKPASLEDQRLRRTPQSCPRRERQYVFRVFARMRTASHSRA